MPRNMIGRWFLSALALALMVFKGSNAWSYNSSPEKMDYETARKWCQEKYTDLVAIQNHEENQHLNEIFDYSAGYYWIGIRKINGVWTWVGTQKSLTEEAMNWAENEPNNLKANEDCVEIYIKRQDKHQGKWNDESCMKKKRALCYTAACHSSSCNRQGECVETINSYQCQCHPGFYGSECEHVATCEVPVTPKQGILNCHHPVGNFSYNSTCSVHCEEGHIPTVDEPVRCTSSGHWSAPLPACKVVECGSLTDPDHGTMTCSQPSGSFPWKTSCTFACQEGFVLKGSDRLQCGSSGKWDREQPKCEAVKCDALSQPPNGSMTCDHSLSGQFSLHSTCHFTCSEGFALRGAAQLECNPRGEWTEAIPTCEAMVCERPKTPEAAVLDCSHNAESLELGTTCNFSCSEGFSLQGAQSLRCVSPGRWTEEVPTCEAVLCTPPSIPERGNMLCSSGNFQSGSSCAFSCEDGFSLRGSANLHCGVTGEWDGEQPTCEAVKCKAVEGPPNGSLQCSHPSSGKFASGTTCDVFCEEGFALQGPAHLECSMQGEWTQQIPTCKVVQCATLTAPEKSVMNCSHPIGNFLFGTVCEFGCPEGWKLNGSAALRCDPTGSWSAIPPTCEAPTVSTTYLAVGMTVTGASLLSTALFLLWLAKRLRKKAKKFIPASSCQSLNSDGTYQTTAELI
ncbi:E-selectin [Ornithorhynchus anatinus]|uniref:E-selectin n=1 Tax=Ornithorhynchus anatinus TaxID=9258 RepID=UPI0010A7B7DF|nr:E-selectin [Ornithorhynchus anatinus]